MLISLTISHLTIITKHTIIKSSSKRAKNLKNIFFLSYSYIKYHFTGNSIV